MAASVFATGATPRAGHAAPQRAHAAGDLANVHFGVCACERVRMTYPTAPASGGALRHTVRTWGYSHVEYALYYSVFVATSPVYHICAFAPLRMEYNFAGFAAL